MLDNVTVINLLTDQSTRRVFKEILKSRIVTKKQLAESIKETDLSVTLKKLEDAGLIDSKEASIPDWNKYFVTADGLAAERILK